jgi:hypothetical protein
VFCGSAADSREHVFAKRLCKRAGAVRFAVISGLSAEGRETVTRNPHNIDAVKVRHVCTRCNNTWMNDLEAWFELRMGCLIEPDWPKLALPVIEALKEERARLAHWLMKTAVMFNLAILKGNHSVEFPADVTQKIRQGVLPDYCWVDLAYSKITTVGGAISKGFRVFNGGKYYPNQVFSDGLGFRFAVQFNHLLLRIARTPGVDVMYASGQDELPMRLYPTSSPTIPKNFAYEDIMSFEHAVFLDTGQNYQSNVP